MMMESTDFQDVSISTYVINLPERTDRLNHIKKQFEDKPEFDLTIVQATRHEIGAVGLWQSIVKIIKMATEADEDLIIICEDDHVFTKGYSKKFLFENIIEANEQGINILSGGIGGFKQIVPITSNRCWMDSFWSTQFIVVFKAFFKTILTEPFTEKDTADGKFSEMTSNKMVLYPFISIQKDFGYSDVTENNNNIKGEVSRLFESSHIRLTFIMDTFHKYKKKKNELEQINDVN